MAAAVLPIDLYAGQGLRLDQAAAAASLAETGGFGGLWTLEAATEPFLPLALAAEHTSRIRLGTAVAVALARNPMVVAHLAHELNRFSGGRLHLGLGTQVGAHIVARFGERFDHPADRMAEFLQALRAIWACWNDEAALDFRGRFYRHTLMTPMFHPGPSPVGAPRTLISAVGPRMTRVAAEHADGLVAHPLTSARYLREVTRPALAETPPGFELVCPVLVITGADETGVRAARRAVRKQVAFYASTPAYRAVLELHGRGPLADRLAALSRQGEWDAMSTVIDDELLAEFSVEAPVDRLAAALRDRYRGLLDRVLVYAPYQVPQDVWASAGLAPLEVSPVRSRASSSLT